MIVHFPFGSQRESCFAALVSSIAISKAGVFSLSAHGNYLTSNSQFGTSMPRPHLLFIWSGFIVLGLDTKHLIFSCSVKNILLNVIEDSDSKVIFLFFFLPKVTFICCLFVSKFWYFSCILKPFLKCLICSHLELVDIKSDGMIYSAS